MVLISTSEVLFNQLHISYSFDCKRLRNFYFTATTEETYYPIQTPVAQNEVPGFASFDKGPSFSFPDFEIDGKTVYLKLNLLLSIQFVGLDDEN